MTSTTSSQRRRLLLAGVVLTLLLAAVFTLGSLDTPFEPRNWRDVLTLYAVSSFITAALVVFALILSRTVLRLWAERSREQLGARFNKKCRALSTIACLGWPICGRLIPTPHRPNVASSPTLTGN